MYIFICRKVESVCMVKLGALPACFSVEKVGYTPYFYGTVQHMYQPKFMAVICRYTRDTQLTQTVSS